VGIDLISEVAASVQLPIIGIGGINPERAADVMSAGARGVAVIGAILGSDDPERAAANLRTAIEEAVQDRVPRNSEGNQRTR
jgi:thiamine-phosphate pyrophosphorylase